MDFVENKIFSMEQIEIKTHTEYEKALSKKCRRIQRIARGVIL